MKKCFDIYIVNKVSYRGSSGVYTGRPSILGNPFYKRTRRENIEDFRQYLWKHVKNKTEIFEELVRLSAIAQNKNLILVCFCKPLDCHGDVINSAIEWMNKNDC